MNDYFYFLPPNVAYNTSILKLKGVSFRFFRMNKSMFILVLLSVVLCTVLVFADPIPLPHNYYRQDLGLENYQDLGILCPIIKRHGKGFVTAQCREWEKNN